MRGFTLQRCSPVSMSFINLVTSIVISNPRQVSVSLTSSAADLNSQNFLVDGTGHVKLTDFGLATGTLNPQKIEDMKNKVSQIGDGEDVRIDAVCSLTR